MKFLGAVQLIIGIGALYLTVTQVITPLWKGTKLFPMLRRERRAVVEELIEAKEEREVRNLRDYLKKEKKK